MGGGQRGRLNKGAMRGLVRPWSVNLTKPLELLSDARSPTGRFKDCPGGTPKDQKLAGYGSGLALALLQ
jgi:hypothetical protein